MNQTTHNPRSIRYPDVNAALARILQGLLELSGSQLIGFYLGGSLALGDFDPLRSDIDFVAVTASEITSGLAAGLVEMHARLWASGEKWLRRLDGSYVPKPVIRRWDSNSTPCPFVEGGDFSITNQGSAVVQRHIVHRYGVIIYGPSPSTLIDPVSADGLRSGLREMLNQWWRPLLDDPDWLQDHRKQPFAVLTMCRALYTLAHGDVVSKPVAARWTKRTLGEDWRGLIEWAMAWPRDAISNRLALTQDLIRYTLERFESNLSSKD